MATIKILVVGDPNSIHTARFTGLLQEIGYQAEVFQSEYLYGQDEHLHNVTLHVAVAQGPGINGNRIKPHYRVGLPSVLARHPGINTLFQKTTSYAFSRKNRAIHLAKLIRKWKPAIVFSLKMQNDGYTVLEAKKLLQGQLFPKWVHFNWGTDIEFFGKDPAYAPTHKPRIQELLASCDFHIADCHRDVRQAREFGFRGTSLGQCLAPGGFDLKELSAIRAVHQNSERNIILVKGRQGGLVGKAFHALEALRRSYASLGNLKVKIFYASPEVRTVAEYFRAMMGIDFEILPRLAYSELLGVYARSRFAISATDVDGTPSFLLEAMAMGALPIHSDMESIREWVTHGENGLLFPVDDIASLTRCIEQAIHNEELIRSAAEKNWKITQERMDRDRIRAHVRELIESKILAISQR